MAPFYDSIERPTLLLDVARARRNITRMAEKARRNQLHFRPHFKTHQSAAVGEWFLEAGVTAATVSSLEMAHYFAEHGWSDLTVAFPANLRQIDLINTLARRVHLHLLVEHPVTAQFLAAHLTAPAGVWIEVDAGYTRSGLSWNDRAQLTALAKTLADCPTLSLHGLLTHAGNTYAARSPDELATAYHTTVDRLNDARNWLAAQGFGGLKISIGDTPACSVLDDLGAVDEIRPGNFVFYDWMQVEIGACHADDVATVVACPVVSIHPERNDLILYGGAVHLSKESLIRRNGHTTFGAVVLLTEQGWSAPLEDVWVRSVSQEHGVVHAAGAAFAALVNTAKVGGLLGVLPVHSCLTADLFKQYRTLDGQLLSMTPIPCASG
jgi:D-serine deaminase-like pyridoxal phosphate-dependent protein